MLSSGFFPPSVEVCALQCFSPLTVAGSRNPLSFMSCCPFSLQGGLRFITFAPCPSPVPGARLGVPSFCLLITGGLSGCCLNSAPKSPIEPPTPNRIWFFPLFVYFMDVSTRVLLLISAPYFEPKRCLFVGSFRSHVVIFLRAAGSSFLPLGCSKFVFQGRLWRFGCKFPRPRPVRLSFPPSGEWFSSFCSPWMLESEGFVRLPIAEGAFFPRRFPYGGPPLDVFLLRVFFLFPYLRDALSPAARARSSF